MIKAMNHIPNTRPRYSIESSTSKHPRKNLEHAKLRSKQYYERKVNPKIFNKDNYVYLLQETLKGKFNDKSYKGI